MKFFFLKEHWLYKIFKTLEKIPNKKTIHVYIDPEHAFFENERRSKQIKEILDKRQIAAFFIAKTERIKNFFEKVWLPYIFQERHPMLKFLHVMYLFFFNIKRFHLHALEKKKLYILCCFWNRIFICTRYHLWTICTDCPERNNRNHSYISSRRYCL